MKFGVEHNVGDWRTTDNLLNFFCEADEEFCKNGGVQSDIKILEELVYQHTHLDMADTIILADLKTKGVILFEPYNMRSSTFTSYIEPVMGSVFRVIKNFGDFPDNYYKKDVSFSFTFVDPTTANFDYRKIPMECCKRVITKADVRKDIVREHYESYYLYYISEQMELYDEYQKIAGV